MRPSYAKSMPEYSGDVITPATPSPAETPHVDTSASEMLALVLEKANREHEPGKEGKQAGEKDTKEHKKETASTEKDKENNSPKEATESKASFLGNIFDLFRHKTDAIDSPTLAAKANRFAAQQEKLKEEKIDSLVKLFVDWIPSKKDTDPLETELSWTAQEIILNAVKQKSVNISDFTERVKLEIQGISSDTVTDEKTNPVLRAHDELTTPALEMAKGFIAQEFPETEKSVTAIPEIEAKGDEAQPEELKQERDLLSQYINKNVTEEARQNAKITDEAERLRKAKEILGPEDDLSPESEKGKAILTAHEIGAGEKGADGENEAGVGNYSIGQLKRKYEELQKADYTRPEIQKLMDGGIVGKRGGNRRGQGPSQEQIKSQLQDQLDEQISIFEKEANDDKGEVETMSEDDLRRFLQYGLNSKANDAIRETQRGLDDAEKLKVEQEIKDEFEGSRQAALDELAGGNLREAVSKAQDLIEIVKRRAIEGKSHRMEEGLSSGAMLEQGGVTNPQNIHDIASLIGEGSLEYATGGDHELIDKNGFFKEENFMYWVQQKFLYFHGQDPDSSQRFFDLIQIENERLFRTVSINTMLSNKDLYFKTADNKPLDELYAYLTDFVWLVGAIRNTHTDYMQQMGEKDKIGGLIAAVMKTNVLTKRSASKDNTLEAVASLSSNFRDWGNVSRLIYEIEIKTGIRFAPENILLKENDRKKILKNENDPDRDERHKLVERKTEEFLKEIEKLKQQEQNMDIGDGVAVGYLMYYNIADIDYLYDKFGDTNLFTRDGMAAVLRKLAKVTNRDDESTKKRKMFDYLSLAQLTGGIDKDAPDAYEQWVNKWYNAEGKLKQEAEKKFIEMFNVFDPPQKNPNQFDLANKLIQLTLGERIEGPMQHPPGEKLDAILANSSYEFAQQLSYFMTYFSGAAAKGDLKVATVNAASGMRFIKNYKKKQGDESRAGGFGNIFNLGALNQSYIDMMIGLPTVGGKNILEIFEEKEQALKRKASFEEKTAIAKQLVFDLNSARQYGIAGPPNAMKIFDQETTGEEVKFSSFIHINAFGHTTYKPSEMLESLQDKVIKPARYAWNTNKAPYEKDVRMLLDDKAEPPLYRTATLFEEMYNPQLRRVIQKIYLHQYGGKEFLDKSGNITRYKINDAGKFVDAQNNVIDTNQAGWQRRAVFADNGKIDPDVTKLLKDKLFRNASVKGYLVNRFAGQIYGHSTRSSSYEYLEYNMREEIFRALASIPIDPEEDNDDFRRSKIGGRYFNKFDMQLMRNLSGNQLWKNVPLAVLKDLRKGVFDGIIEMLKRFGKGVSS